MMLKPWSTSWRPLNTRRKLAKRNPTTAPKPSKLSQVVLRGHWGKQFAAFTARTLATLTMVFALYFGASHTIFDLRDSLILGWAFDVDLQLALIGLVNKIFDLMITTALKDSAEVLITRWMISDAERIVTKCSGRSKRKQIEPGVYLGDFELSEELTKPWKSLGAFGSRFSALGWKRAGWIRLLLTFACSTSVLFSGLAINTIGIPKARWLPDEWETQQTPTPLIQFQGQGLDWGQFWSFGWGVVGGGPVSWQAADAMTTASTYSVFKYFRDEFVAQPQGWRAFHKDPAADQDFATIDSRYNGATCRGFAGQGSASRLLFEHFQESGFPHAAIATGWSANLTLAWPSTTVSCGSFRNISTSVSSVYVDANFNPDHYPNRMFGISMLPFNRTDNTSFSGANCNVSFERLLFPTITWIVQNATGSVSPNNWGHGDAYTSVPAQLPETDVDRNITQRLAVQVAAVTSRLENLLSSDISAAQFFVLAARNLRTWRPEYQTDVEGLAPVVSLLTNYLLSIASWNITLSPSETTTSTQIRFEVIGSGPRLQWEWSVTIIFSVLLIACLLGFAQSGVYRVAPLECVKAKGMLVAANRSPTLERLNTALAQGEGDTARVRLGVRTDTSGSVQIVDLPENNHLLDKKRTYDWRNNPQIPTP